MPHEQGSILLRPRTGLDLHFVVPGQFLGCRELVRMRACPKHASERSLYCTGLSKGLSCAGWLRHPGARPSARSQRRAILAPGCARKPGGRTPVLSARRVPRLASRLARQLAFLRKPMAAHGVPLPRRGVDGASCAAPPSAMFAATVRPAPHPAASGGGPRKTCAQGPGRRKRVKSSASLPRRFYALLAGRPLPASGSPDGGGLAMRNAPGGSTRLVSPRMRHLRHSRRGQGGIPPVCGADGDDVGIGRRKFDAAAQRRLRRRPPSASRRQKRIRRRAAPRAAGRHRRMRRGADLAASMPEGEAVKPRTGDGALLRAHGFRSSARTGKCDTLRNPRNRPGTFSFSALPGFACDFLLSVSRSCDAMGR